MDYNNGDLIVARYDSEVIRIAADHRYKGKLKELGLNWPTGKDFLKLENKADKLGHDSGYTITLVITDVRLFLLAKLKFSL